MTGITFNNRTNLYVAGSFNSTAGVYGVDLDTGQYGRSLGLDFYTSATDSTATRKLRIDAAGAAEFTGRVTAAGVTTSAALIKTENSKRLAELIMAFIRVVYLSIDGTTIALSSGDMTLDVAGDINLDADGGSVFFKDADRKSVG